MSRVSHTCKWVVCIHLVIDWHSSSDLLTFIQWSIDIYRKRMRQDTKCARCLIHSKMNETSCTKNVNRSIDEYTRLIYMCLIHFRWMSIDVFIEWSIDENDWYIVHISCTVYYVSFIFENEADTKCAHIIRSQTRNVHDRIMWAHVVSPSFSKMNET